MAVFKPGDGFKRSMAGKFGRRPWFSEGVVIPPPEPDVEFITSASNRARQPLSWLNTGANNFVDHRVLDRTSAPAAALRHAFANEAVSVVSTNRVETIGAALPTISHSTLTAISAPGDNQSAADQTISTFAGAASDSTWTGPDGEPWSHILKRTGGGTTAAAYVAATYAELVAAGGSIDTAAGYPAASRLTIPGGFVVFSDEMALPRALAAGDLYYHQTTMTAPASTTSAFPGVSRCDGSIDKSKASASLAAAIFLNKNWTGVSGLGPNTGEAYHPILTLTTGNAAQPRPVLITGDSIGAGEPGDGRGNTDLRASGIFKRALAAAGYPYFATTVPSSRSSAFNVTGAALANLIARFGHDLFMQHWANDRSSGGLAANRTHTLAMKALMVPNAPKRAIWFTGVPKVTGGANASAVTISAITSSGTVATATVASTAALTVGQQIQIGMADVAGYNGVVTVASIPNGTSFTFTIPGGASDLAAATTARYAFIGGSDIGPAHYQYTTYSPYVMRTGAYAGVPFDKAAGDPDLGMDVYAMLGADGAFHATLASSHEGTHPLGNNTSGLNSAAVETAAAAMAALIPGALPAQ